MMHKKWFRISLAISLTLGLMAAGSASAAPTLRLGAPVLRTATFASMPCLAKMPLSTPANTIMPMMQI